MIQTATTGFQSLFNILLGVAGIGFLIGFHELGHFLFCKLFGVHTPSFSIGMGPQILQKKIGQTNFKLSAIPLGGYVEIAGEDHHKDLMIPKEQLFTSKPYYQKMLIISGGIIFNLFFAYCVFSALFFIGMPKSPLAYPAFATTSIAHIETDSPAAQADLQQGDTIIKLNETTITGPSQIIDFIKDHPDATMKLEIKRQQELLEKTVTLGAKDIEDKKIGFLGVEFNLPSYSLKDSLILGAKALGKLIVQIGNSFKSIISKRSTEKIGGPVMVIAQTIKGASKGLKIFLLLLAFISVNLAVLNIIPLPILDGGQALFYTIEAIIGRPLPEKIKMGIHYACWILILLLAFYLTTQDILRIFWS